MKNVQIPFGISSISGTSFCAVKMTARISKSHRTHLMKEFSNLNVVEIPRKDGEEPVIYKFTMVCSYNEACRFYGELRLAILDRKEAEIVAERLIIQNEMEERGYIPNPYAMSADKPPHVVGFIDLNKPYPVDDDLFGDDIHDELPW